MSDPATFRARFQRAKDAIENHMGEPMTVYPAVSHPRAEPEVLWAEGWPIRAAFRNRALETVLTKQKGGLNGPHHNMAISTRLPEVQVSLATLNGLPFPLTTGCLIRRDTEGEVYGITDILADGIAFATLSLTEKQAPRTLSGLAAARADVAVVGSLSSEAAPVTHKPPTSVEQPPAPAISPPPLPSSPPGMGRSMRSRPAGAVRLPLTST